MSSYAGQVIRSHDLAKLSYFLKINQFVTTFRSFDCPLNNYFFLHLIVMQCSVNKIFHCISLDYLLAASDYSVRSRLLVVNFSSKTPGARPVTGARDKPLRHVHSYRKHNLCRAFVAGLI